MSPSHNLIVFQTIHVYTLKVKYRHKLSFQKVSPKFSGTLNNTAYKAKVIL